MDEQTQHQRRRELCAAAAAVIDARRPQIQQPHRVHDEMHEMIFRHPSAQIGRQKQRGVVVDVDEARGPVLSTCDSRKTLEVRQAASRWR